MYHFYKIIFIDKLGRDKLIKIDKLKLIYNDAKN
jgi:hypothetical protein